MPRTNTWQEDGVWYASPLPYFSDDPVGEGDNEDDAILNLEHKIADRHEAARIQWEARHDER
jgi:hypothetical protein